MKSQFKLFIWKYFSLGGRRMRHRKLAFWLFTGGLMLLLTIGIFFLLPAQPVGAQCGSQASSCKNCHETQAQDPVNTDGTTWHTQHAFGDFCYLCHAGNNQATEKTASHNGMVDPLKDVVAACKSCHAKDYEAKAQIYATTLGVTFSSGAVAPTQVAGQPVPSTSAVSTAAPALAQAAAVPAADMVDYSQRYDEIALGKKPVNIGNIIVIVLIAALVLGGGFFVARREGWFKVSFQDTKTIQGSYPADVVDMVPELAKLKPAARKNLRQILLNPGMAAELFALVNKLVGKEGPSTSVEKKPAEPPEA
jgi:hypothetical protein